MVFVRRKVVVLELGFRIGFFFGIWRVDCGGGGGRWGEVRRFFIFKEVEFGICFFFRW